MRYLKESDIDWCYWCLDGYKCNPEADETYGIYDRTFTQERNPDIINDLRSIMKPA